MEMNLFRRESVDFAFRRGHPLKDGHRFFFYPRGKPAGDDKLSYLSERSLMIVRV